MPIPKPSKNEQRDDFMQRCMGNETMVKEYPGPDQRAAVCQSTWVKAKKRG